MKTEVAMKYHAMRLRLRALLLPCAVALAAGAANGMAAAKPKVMLMIDEKSLGTISTSEVEAMAIKTLADKQVETVDRDMVAANAERMKEALRIAGDNRGAAALGREFGADIVLVGEAVAKPSARRIAESNLRSYEAAVTLRAVRSDNAVNLASASETVSVIALEDVAGSAKALKAAGGKALGALVPEMLEKWEKAATADPAEARKINLDITVGGVDQMWKLKAVREKLRGLKDADSVTQQSYAQGLAVFKAASLVASEDLAEKIVLDPPEGLKMQVVEIKPGSIVLRVVETERKEGE